MVTLQDDVIIALAIVTFTLILFICLVLYQLWIKGYFGRTVVVNVHEGNLQRIDIAEMTAVGPGINGKSIHESPFRVDWNDIELGSLLGRGTYGEVYQGRFRGTDVAVKKIIKQSLEGTSIDQFEIEFKTLSELRHPNIVLFMGACMTLPNLSLITEFCPKGSLRSVLDDDEIILPMELRLKMALGTVLGMLYLHSNRPPIIHRDLKSPNLLVDENFTIKVSDFGLTTLLDDREEDGSFAGSINWAAPETMKGLAYTLKCDVYSFGIVLWEIISRHHPYEGVHPLSVGYQVMKAGLRPSPCGPKDLQKLMTICWDENPEIRPTFLDIADIISHSSQASDPFLDPLETGASLAELHPEKNLPEHIPEPGLLYIVCHSIHGAPFLWQTWPGTMKQAVRLHNWKIRELAKVYQGYENSIKFGSFVLIFDALENAVGFCLESQEVLMFIQWDIGVYNMTNCHRETSESGETLFNGLRLSQGVTSGKLECEIDENTQRHVFFGKEIDICEHLCHVAQGGQTIFPEALVSDISEIFVNDIDSQRSTDSTLLSGSDFDENSKPPPNTIIRSAGRVSLQTEVKIYEIVPEKLCGRHFRTTTGKGIPIQYDALSQWMINYDDLEIGDIIVANDNVEACAGKWGDCKVYCKRVKAKAAEREVLDWNAELNIQAQVRHPNIVSFLGVCFKPELVFVTEYQLLGTLDKFLAEQWQNLDITRKVKMLIDVSRGLCYLHSFNPPIIHLYLSSSTLTVGSNLQIKLSNFSFAGHKTDDKGLKVAYSYVQSFQFRSCVVAPEILRDEFATESSDVYSFAMVMYEILSGMAPFSNEGKTMDVVVDVIAGYRPKVPTNIGSNFRELMEVCWSDDFQNRPSSLEILQKLNSFPRSE